MDTSTSDPSVEYGFGPSRGDRAAAFVLGQVASRGELASTLAGLGLLQRHPVPSLYEVDTRQLDVMLTVGELQPLVTATGMRPAELRQPLLEQLHRVAMFAHTDGGGESARANVAAAEHLIRSGRAAMFSR